nr:MAG TPA: hypothetical protein [Caudoviricetes sp.]
MIVLIVLICPFHILLFLILSLGNCKIIIIISIYYDN